MALQKNAKCVFRAKWPTEITQETPHVATHGTVAKYHMQDPTGSIANILQAYLLNYDDEPRWVNSVNRNTKELESIPVLSILLADRTGPIIMDLWRSAAETMPTLFTKWSNSIDGKAPLLEIKMFNIQDERRSSLNRTRKLHSVESTTIQLLHDATQESILSSTIQLNANMYIKDMTKLNTPLPFIVSIVGIISALQPPRPTQNGNLRTAFRLHDKIGNYVMCCALGRHAESDLLQESNELVLYFTNAQPGINNSPGSLWIYDDSHIIKLRSNCTVPLARNHIQLRNAM